MKTIIRQNGAMAKASAAEEYQAQYDFNRPFYVVAKIVLGHLGISFPAMSIAMGYKSKTSLNTYLTKSVRTGYSKRNFIQACRDLGASEDDMRALVYAYILETGDTTFGLSERSQKKLATLVCDMLDAEGELHRPGGVRRSPYVSRKRLEEYRAQCKENIKRSAIQNSKGSLEKARAALAEKVRKQREQKAAAKRQAETEKPSDKTICN